MSAAYTREHDGHSAARRLPHRTCSTPSGLSDEQKRRDDLTRRHVDGLRGAVEADRPGAVPDPGGGSDQASKSRDTSRAMTCASGPGRGGPGPAGGPRRQRLRRSRGGRGRASQTRSRVARLISATPFPRSGWVCRAADATRAARHTRSEGRPRKRCPRRRCRRRGGCSQPATSIDHEEDHEGDGGREDVCGCVTAIRVDGLWPGWGADPQGIKPACLSVQVFCVGMSALPTIHTPRRSGTKKHAESPRTKFHPHADVRMSAPVPLCLPLSIWALYHRRYLEICAARVRAVPPRGDSPDSYSLARTVRGRTSQSGTGADILTSACG